MIDMKKHSIPLLIVTASAVATGVVLFTPKPLTEMENIPIASMELALINDTRQEIGLPLLQRNVKLDESARQKCEDMVRYDYWSHNRDNKEWEDFISQEYTRAGEIMARGFGADKQSQNRAWMDSYTHAEQIMGYYTDFGSAVCNYDNGKDLTVVHFKR